MSDPQRKERSHRTRVVLYWIDECLVLFISVVSVVIADTLVKRSQGRPAAIGDVFLDPLNLVVSAFLALIVYGSMYTKWRYNDADKPPFFKRAANAALQGVAWRTLVGGVSGGS